MAWVNTPLQLGILRFLLGFADGALMPAVQALLLKYSSDQVTGRIFGYNQSFMYLGSVVGPLLGSGISAMMGFRWVFAVTAVLVLAMRCSCAISSKSGEPTRGITGMRGNASSGGGTMTPINRATTAKGGRSLLDAAIVWYLCK